MTLFVAGLGLVLSGGVAAVALARRPRLAARGYGALVLAGCALALVPAVRVLGGGRVSALTIPAQVPGGVWLLGMDALSAWFVALILLAGALTALFGTWYMAAEREHGSVPRAQLGFAALLVGPALVVTAQAVVFFLAAWELMALAAYYLVVFDDRQADVRRAGLIYLTATHAATLLLIVMFALWSRNAPDLTFASLATAELGAGVRSLLLGLALLAFGIKAGFVPLHFWLPEAHAAAPSHVSALMSGVVIKTGIYGLLRVIALVGAPPAWWGWLVLILGALSGVLGVLWALAQHDLKRLLAYHSVENIGIILLGVGVGALGLAYEIPLLAALGFLGAALHTLNHALFKSLLFLGAGSVLRATGTRELERLGALARRMPLTWIAFLVGSIAIVGLPPLNGFVSEWIVFQALFRAGLGGMPVALAVFGAPALGLIGGLALACFAKVCGTAFLGHPRTSEAAAAAEGPTRSWAPALGLALACVVVGVFPWLVMRPALEVTGLITGIPSNLAGDLTARELGGATRISLVAAVLAGVIAVVAALRGIARKRTVTAVTETWGCGYTAPTPRMQYTASSFAAPLVGVFGSLGGVAVHHEVRSFATHPSNLVLKRALEPAWRALRRAGGRLRPMQHGRLHLYLLYIVATVSLLLLYLAIFGGER
jgi:formate hydrogenlyase subunit 3/multisubunit Na+/H+ antiporter MnhD subunit